MGEMKLGDKLLNNNIVTEIESEITGGEYLTPYTSNGTILVNGIGVSSFSFGNLSTQKLLVKMLDSLLATKEAEIGMVLENADLEDILFRIPNITKFVQRTVF